MRAARTMQETFESRRDEGDRVTVSRTTWGEPFDEGVNFTFQGGGECVSFALVTREARDLHEHLGKLLATLR